MEAVYIDKHYSLVAECKQGSKKACYELYRLYAKAMLNVAYRIVGNVEEAEDVLQEAFVDAFNKLKDFRQETTFGLWLKQIVVNRSINLLRKRRLELVEMESGQLENIADEVSYDDEDMQYQVAQIKQAIQLLPEGYRVVLTLYLIEGYDHEEIGQILKINENTSRTQFLRAKRKLSEILKQKGKSSMSKRLEDFIHDNRDEFDELEPKAAIWDNIEQRLSFTAEAVPKKKEAKTFSLGFVLRVAAMVIMVMGIGFVLYLRNEKPASVNLAAINPVYAKQQSHYASLVKAKRIELKSIQKIDPQLYNEFNGEIAKMDSTYKKLTNDLKTTPNQERVLRAMIRNLQVQSEVLNQQLQVIEQYNEQIKLQKDENKNI